MSGMVAVVVVAGECGRRCCLWCRFAMVSVRVHVRDGDGGVSVEKKEESVGIAGDETACRTETEEKSLV